MPKFFYSGCLHGEWDLLLDTVEKINNNSEEKIDLIIVAGDCQTFRSASDMDSFAAPLKYHLLGSFYKIANGERKAPCPIILIGGNHEAGDLIFQLPFGGYIAPNVYYMGRGCQLQVGNILITGMSGLYKPYDYYLPVNETFPLRTPNDIHTAISIRAFTEFQLFKLTKTDLMITHDWPSSIPTLYSTPLFRRVKSYLIEADKNGTFGFPLGMKFIEEKKPKTWIAAHHHITMKVKINNDTEFCALCKPTREEWYEVREVEGEMGPIKITGEWMSILKATSKEMEDPSLLKADWNEIWEKKGPLEPHEAVDLEPFNPDPVATTIGFCKKYGIYCPNPEIRKLM